jgi:hypothetical protein
MRHCDPESPGQHRSRADSNRIALGATDTASCIRPPTWCPGSLGEGVKGASAWPRGERARDAKNRAIDAGGSDDVILSRARWASLTLRPPHRAARAWRGGVDARLWGGRWGRGRSRGPRGLWARFARRDAIGCGCDVIGRVGFAGYGRGMGRRLATACVHGHAYPANAIVYGRRGWQRCRICTRASEGRRVRDYASRKTAACSECGKPCYPSMTVTPDGERVARATQTCRDCRRARRAIRAS